MVANYNLVPTDTCELTLPSRTNSYLPTRARVCGHVCYVTDRTNDKCMQSLWIRLIGGVTPLSNSVYVSYKQFLTTCSPLANYFTKGQKKVTILSQVNRSGGGRETKPAIFETGSSSRHYTLTLGFAFKAHEMLYVFIYSVGTYGGQKRCLEAFGGEIRGKHTTWKTRASMGG